MIGLFDENRVVFFAVQDVINTVKLPLEHRKKDK